MPDQPDPKLSAENAAEDCELFENILAIEQAMGRLTSGGLNRRAIEVLLQDSAFVKTGRGQPNRRVGLDNIRAVLDAICELRARYSTETQKCKGSSDA